MSVGQRKIGALPLTNNEYIIMLFKEEKKHSGGTGKIVALSKYKFLLKIAKIYNNNLFIIIIIIYYLYSAIYNKKINSALQLMSLSY